MPRQNEEEFLFWALRGHRQAVAFCQGIFRISQVWDDLIDRDRAVSDAQVNEAFWTALVSIPQNPFYAAHMIHLTPLLSQYIVDWMDATRLEGEGEHEESIAFVLRDSVGSIIIQCAYLVGGFEWMNQVSQAVREHIFEETLEQYREGLK